MAAKKYAHINFTPPQDVRNAAKRGLELHEDGKTGSGLEPITVVWARRIANGEDISPDKARQGNRWWGRNKRFLGFDQDSPAYAAAMLWFGKPGQRWMAKLVDQMDGADMKNKSLAELADMVMVVRSLQEAGKAGDGRYSRPAPLTYKSEVHTGAMVALFLPTSTGIDFVLDRPDAVPPNEMHVTLAYLGKADELADWQIEHLHEIIEMIAENHPPLQGNINGCGRFCNDEDVDPFFIIPDLPKLPELRQCVVGFIDSRCEIDPPSNHGFSPHITLGYVPHSNPNPFDNVELTPVTFPTISLVLADKRYDYPFLMGLDNIGKALVQMAGARHTAAECAKIQQMHDMALELGAECHPLTRRAGAKHSVADQGMIQRLHDDCVSLGAECKALPERDMLHYGQVMKEGEIIKGSARSGNYAHTGRPGKHGGSTKGGGHRRIGAKKDDSPQDIKDKAKKRRKYSKKTGLGEKLFNKVKNGGELKLTDGDIDVDVSIKTFGGAYGMAVKKPGDSSFGKHFTRSSTDIKNYLDQFRERKQKKQDKDLGDIPKDLTKMSEKQFDASVKKLSKLPLKELRRRQDLNEKQTKIAYDAKNDSALKNLKVREELYLEAIMEKEFKANLTTRAQSDAPNYLPASTPERCKTCTHFRGDPGEDYCTRFEFTADQDYVCDDWEADNPDEIPGYVDKADSPVVLKDWENSTLAQRSARDAINNAIKAGKLAKASTKKCRRCQKRQAQEYHHVNGYSKDKRLRVIPLCSSCHSIVDNKKPEVGKADLASLVEGILVLRGGATSGNWGHAGRPKKRGGSKSGGGFKRIGVKPGASRKKVAQAAKKKQGKQAGKDQKTQAKPKKQAAKKAEAKPKAKETESKYPSTGSKKLDDIFSKAPKGSEKLFTNHLTNKIISGDISLAEGQKLVKRFKEGDSKPSQSIQTGNTKSAKKFTEGELKRGDDKKQWSSWAAGLSSKEKSSLKAYSSEPFDGLSTDYRKMNNYLRGTDKNPSKETRDAIKDVDRAINKGSLAQDTVVFRGFPSKVLGKNPQDMVGKVFEDKAYMSTSKSERVAETFGHDLILEMRLPKGTKGAYLDASLSKSDLRQLDRDPEHELLLPRGSKFRVIGTEKVGERTKMIMELIDNG